MRRTYLAALHAIGVLALTGPAGAQELDEPGFTRCVMTNYQIAQGLPPGRLTRNSVETVTASAPLPLTADLVLQAPPGFELSHVKSDAPGQVDKALRHQTSGERVVKVVLSKSAAQVQKDAAPARITLTAVVSRIVSEEKAQAIVRSCLDEHQTKIK